jgi:hypothetical protein
MPALLGRTALRDRRCAIGPLIDHGLAAWWCADDDWELHRGGIPA